MSDVTVETRNTGGRPKMARGVATSSAEAGPAWSIRGVPQNVRVIATREAAQRGATVGDWVSEAIVRHARGEDASDQTEVKSDDRNLPAVRTAEEQLPEILEMIRTQGRLARAVERQTRELRLGRFRRRH